MRYLSCLLIIICLLSCDYFEKKKISADDILEGELQSFNWNEVDEYPSFVSCDSSVSKMERRQCFESILTQHISSKIQASNFVVSEAINDTVQMAFSISSEGEIRIKAIEHSDIIKQQIPELDSILRLSIHDLPELLPAIKRGQHVNTEFILPLVVNAN
ncbi:MAG: hypothetical protein KJO77_00885 [Bacteroidia bacterium]|nr:hypothetical protein [Bacteroidia bacterium]NND51767.1 hypothetical protein [Flavobacteriaceae bacterium]